MNKAKTILKVFLAVFFASALLTPSATHAIAVISSLDFSLTGSKVLDCEILGNVELERDPSWSNEEFYIRLLEKYMVETSEGEWSTVEEYRNSIYNEFEPSWNLFFSYIFESYADYYIEDYWDRQDYYSTYHAELKDEYYRAYNFAALGTSPEELEDTSTYDVIANYCASEEYITTTYGDYGYSGYIRLNGREVAIDEEALAPLDNGYVYHEDGFGELKVELIRINSTTIRAKYTLKNLTGLSTDYGVAFYTDVELGENDEAAISKTNRVFTITQDDSWYDSSFGAQFNIELDPVPTTSFVGFYIDAEDFRWTNSPRDYYTAADGVDTGLSYSWQGQIGANETKIFSATYTIGVAETFENYFYYLDNDYAEPRLTVGAIDGGALRLPSTDMSARAGWHRDWNTKADGSGVLFKTDSIIISDQDRNNYYETEVPNEVLPYISNGWKNLEEHGVVVTEEMKEKLQELADEAYSDVSVYSYIDELDDEDTEYLTTEGIVDTKKVTDASGEGYNFKDLFSIYEVGKSYLDGEGSWHEIPFEESEYPITIRIKLPERLIKDKGDFGIVRVECDDEFESCSEYQALPTRFNRETGELFFDIDKMGNFFYALTYTDAPEVPNTGFNVASSSIVETIILLPTLAAVSIIVASRLNSRKRQ